MLPIFHSKYKVLKKDKKMHLKALGMKYCTHSKSPQGPVVHL